MSFDHLSESDFEEFSYELLSALGFVNVNWRRGSGKGGASADQGRDIVAQMRRRDIDGAEHMETWFVQCKHYERGVPPEPLQPAVSWATAERPDVLLFVVSNFLSNPAKNWLGDYELNNRPPFRLKLWERKDLERLLSSYPSLARKYRISAEDVALTVHPAHLQYVLRPSQNTLGYFFAYLDTMEPTMRDNIFGWSYLFAICPRFRKPNRTDERLVDAMLDPVDYGAFRAKCYRLAPQIAENFLVQAIVSDTLRWVWSLADVGQVAQTIERHQQAIRYFARERDRRDDPKHKAALDEALARHQQWMNSAPDQQKTWEGYYKFICETVLPHLYLEKWAVTGRSLDEILAGL